MSDSEKSPSHRISIIDTHTGGEPTRLVTSGGPDLGPGSVAERSVRFARDFDPFRSSVVNEPRGSDVLVGALLCEAVDPTCVAGVIFFNNVGMLGMCGHGTIGVAVALAHSGRILPGRHALETPVGRVTFTLHDDLERVTFENVPSYRLASAVEIDVPTFGRVTGDVAWGGNWFFLVRDHGQELSSQNVDQLTRYSLVVRQSLENNSITGKHGAAIDHIELFGPSRSPNADSRNFVLCPGGAYDRSPCGTGTSAKIACLAADHQLQPGQIWRQESIIGSIFEATYREGQDGTVIPIMTGAAWVTAEGTLLRNDRDPFKNGIR